MQHNEPLDNFNSAYKKLEQAFNSDKFEDVVLTGKEAMTLKCFFDTLKGQNERLTEEINQLETKLLHS